MTFPFCQQPGEHFETEHFEVLFANKHFSKTVESSPSKDFCLLHQVHGDQVVEATTAHKMSADAHWTTDKTKTLLIKSADCLPVLIYSPQKKLALAIHAGWRGVEQKITSKALQQLDLTTDKKLAVYIGPHIQQNSFEVDLDVFQKLMNAHQLPLNLNDRNLFFKKDQKYHINLSALVERELQGCGIAPTQISISKTDTLTNLDYYSFRRGDTGVRNYSVIRIK